MAAVALVAGLRHAGLEHQWDTLFTTHCAAVLEAKLSNLAVASRCWPDEIECQCPPGTLQNPVPTVCKRAGGRICELKTCCMKISYICTCSAFVLLESSKTVTWGGVTPTAATPHNSGTKLHPPLPLLGRQLPNNSHRLRSHGHHDSPRNRWESRGCPICDVNFCCRPREDTHSRFADPTYRENCGPASWEANRQYQRSRNATRQPQTAHCKREMYNTTRRVCTGSQ